MFESIASDDVVSLSGLAVQNALGHAVHVVPHHSHHGPVQLHHGHVTGLEGKEVGQESPVTSAQDEDVSTCVEFFSFLSIK